MKMMDMLPDTKPKVGGFLIAVILSAIITKYVINPILPDLWFK